MLYEYLWIILINIDLKDIFFQQDGAEPHSANDTINLSRQKLSGRIISIHDNVTIGLFSVGLSEKP